MAIYNDDASNKKYTAQGMKEPSPKEGDFHKKPGTEQQPGQNPTRKPGQQETTSNPKGPFQSNR